MELVKEMTTAEFAKANLSAVTEPIRIRRYTTVLGVYYPQDREPDQPTLDTLYAVMPGQPDRVRELEDEVAHLKRQLAARSERVEVAKPRADFDLDALPKQDRQFFERKLGVKKK